MTKKYFNGSYGYVGWVEKLGRNIEFTSEKEYLEFIEDSERIEDIKNFIELVDNDGMDAVQIGVF